MAFSSFRGAAGLAGAAVAGLAAVVAWLVMFEEGGEELPLFDTHKAFVQLGMFCKILLGLFGFVVILGIVEHGGAHTVLTLFAHEDLIVDTALTAGPEILVLGELGVGHGLVAELGIDLHDGQTGGETEDLGFGVCLTAELEYLFLYLFGKTAFPELGGYDKAGVGDIFPVTPGLDVAEPGPDAVLGEGYDRLALAHFLLDVVGAPFGNTGASRHCR